MEQVNAMLQRELSDLISREVDMEDCLITVCYVDCSPDLKSAKVGVSVLPENKTASALHKLRVNTSLFCKELKGATRIKTIPKFNWVEDRTEREAAEIEEILGSIHNS